MIGQAPVRSRPLVAGASLALLTLSVALLMAAAREGAVRELVLTVAVMLALSYSVGEQLRELRPVRTPQLLGLLFAAAAVLLLGALVVRALAGI